MYKIVVDAEPCSTRRKFIPINYDTIFCAGLSNLFLTVPVLVMSVVRIRIYRIQGWTGSQNCRDWKLWERSIRYCCPHLRDGMAFHSPGLCDIFRVSAALSPQATVHILLRERQCIRLHHRETESRQTTISSLP